MRVDFSKLILSILFVGLFLAIDLWTKHQVTISTVMHGKSFGPDGILGIVKPVMNYGGGGVFSSDVPNNSHKLWHFFLALISIYVFVTMVLYNHRLWHSALGAIPVGGVWGNSFEFLAKGGVTDFIVSNGLGFLDAFVMNIADIFIFVGLLVFNLTSEAEIFDKVLVLLIVTTIFSIILGLLPAEIYSFVLLAGLFILLLWPNTNEGSTEKEVV